MIATHNIKVNGRWYSAGEEYEVEKTQTVEQIVAEPAVPAPVEEEPQASPKARTTTRRKTVK